MNAEVVALVSFWTLVKQDVAFSIWNKVDDPKMIPLEEIKCFFAFQKPERQSVCSDLAISLQVKIWG